MLASAPLYALGLPVMVCTVGERVLIDQGFITGLELDPNAAFLKGWWYSVRFTDGPGAGFQEWVPEQDITSMAIAAEAVGGEIVYR